MGCNVSRSEQKEIAAAAAPSLGPSSNRLSSQDWPDRDPQSSINNGLPWSSTNEQLIGIAAPEPAARKNASLPTASVNPVPPDHVDDGVPLPKIIVSDLSRTTEGDPLLPFPVGTNHNFVTSANSPQSGDPDDISKSRLQPRPNCDDDDDELDPSVQSDGFVCSVLMRELACLGEPGFEPPPPDRFMTLVEGDGPTTREMWAQLGADVMMEHAATMMSNHLEESI